MTYQPKPIDTSHIILNREIAQLTEKLAENAHDEWASQRLQEGWTLGPKRDDGKKQHPSLIPYGQLSESEKEYDRITAMKTIKALIALGYKIEKI